MDVPVWSSEACFAVFRQCRVRRFLPKRSARGEILSEASFATPDRTAGPARTAQRERPDHVRAARPRKQDPSLRGTSPRVTRQSRPAPRLM